MPTIPTGTIQVTEFLGLNLAQDARQFAKTTVLRGQNFIVNAEGVKAEFASEFISEFTFGKDSADKSQTFRQSTYILHFVTGAILRFDTMTQRYYPLFQFADPAYDFPWSQARIGGEYYYCKYGVGIIRYTPNTGAYQIMTPGVNGVPTNAYGVCMAGGRLVCLSLGLITWSVIDQGYNMTTDASTGTGAQDLSIIGDGDPLGIFETATGWIAFSKTGVLRGRITGAVVPYMFDKILINDVPINPWAITTIDGGRVVYLSKVGLLITQNGLSYNNGDQPAEYDAMMSEYLSQKYYKTVDLSKNTIIRLSYEQDRNWFIISLGSTGDPSLYTKAYVLYKGKWGSFDTPHHCFGEFDLSAGPYSGFNYGFIDSLGYVHRFTETPHIETTRRTSANYWYRPPLDYPPQLGIPTAAPTPAIFSTGINVDAESFTPYVTYGAGVWGISPINSIADPLTVSPFVEAVYGDTTWSYDDRLTNPYGYADIDWNTSPNASADWNVGYDAVIFPCGLNEQINLLLSGIAVAPPVYGAINSLIDVGLFRFTDGQTSDRTSIVQAFTLGANSLFISTMVDYLTTSNPDQDWNSGSGSYDWGIDFTSTAGFSVYIAGTLDGINQFEDQYFNPSYVLNAQDASFYRQECTGLYAYIRISAQNANEFFHLKTLDVEGILGGRMF